MSAVQMKTKNLAAGKISGVRYVFLPGICELNEEQVKFLDEYFVKSGGKNEYTIQGRVDRNEEFSKSQAKGYCDGVRRELEQRWIENANTPSLARWANKVDKGKTNGQLTLNCVARSGNQNIEEVSDLVPQSGRELVHLALSLMAMNSIKVTKTGGKKGGL